MAVPTPEAQLPAQQRVKLLVRVHARIRPRLEQRRYAGVAFRPALGAEGADYLSLHHVLADCLLREVVCRRHARVGQAREPVADAVTQVRDRLFDLGILICIMPRDDVAKPRLEAPLGVKALRLVRAFERSFQLAVERVHRVCQRPPRVRRVAACASTSRSRYAQHRCLVRIQL